MTQSIALIFLSSGLSAQGLLDLVDKGSLHNVVYSQRLPTAGILRLPEMFPSQAHPFDYDNDGDEDLLLTYGPLREDTTGFALNRLYRNDGDRWIDVTISTRLSLVPPAGNAAIGDIDGDGFLDIYFSRLGPDIMLRNNGGQEWVDVTAAAGIDNQVWSTAAQFLDVNGDGALDLYVANFVDYPEIDTLICKDAKRGQIVVCDPDIYDQAANRLYINDGTGRFSDMTDSLGFADSTSRSTGVIAFDANGDHRLDLLVTSHLSANLLYRQHADARWTESAWSSGLAMVPSGEERAWNQVLPLDADGDGLTDLLFIDAGRNLLLMRNHGEGMFFPDDYRAGLFRPGEPLRGSLALNLDVDFDNLTDLVMMNAGNDSVSHSQYVLQARPGGAFGQIPTSIDLAIDTVVTRPYMEIDTTTELDDFLSEVTGPVFDPSIIFVPAADSIPALALIEALDSLAFADSLQVDSLGVDTTGVSPADSVFLTPSPELADHWEQWDTVRVDEVPAQLLAADLDRDGVKELIATYPSGVLKVWAQQRPRRHSYIGLLPRTSMPGETHVGAIIRVVVKKNSWMAQVTESEPLLVFLPPRTRLVTVQVFWPDGQVSEYSLSDVNRYYTLSPDGEVLP